MKITIGNDFIISWTITQLGEAFTLEGKTYELVVRSSYGVIDVANVIASGNTLTFTVPASSQIYTGSYDVVLNIAYGDNHWRLCHRDVFELVPCGGEIAGVVQLNSDIVYPYNGLSAYELAVASGEYTGDYEGYQRWLARYAEATAGQALDTAQQANATAGDAKTIAQQANAAASNLAAAIQNEATRATAAERELANSISSITSVYPSGDPMHEAYVYCGATWNKTTGFWELNGLTDLTNADMLAIYNSKRLNIGVLGGSSFSNAFAYADKDARTNFVANTYQTNNSYSFGDCTTLCAYSNIEVLCLMEDVNSGGCYPMNLKNAFFQANKLKTIIGIINLRYCSEFGLTFAYASSIENVKIQITKDFALKFNSKNLSKESILYMIENATVASTVTLAASVYTWAMADADILAALDANTNITLASA